MIGFFLTVFECKPDAKKETDAAAGVTELNQKALAKCSILGDHTLLTARLIDITTDHMILHRKSIFRIIRKANLKVSDQSILKTHFLIPILADIYAVKKVAKALRLPGQILEKADLLTASHFAFDVHIDIGIFASQNYDMKFLIIEKGDCRPLFLVDTGSTDHILK